jgi:hypothetical protein
MLRENFRMQAALALPRERLNDMRHLARTAPADIAFA